MGMLGLLGASWKTSLGSLLVAAGYMVEILGDAKIGEALKVAGTALIGLAARDNTVTSEQAGAK